MNVNNGNSIHHKNPTDIADSSPESKNPNKPLLFAPGVLLRCGMRDAHSFPLVGRRDHDGAIRASWRESPSSAWTRELIEMARTGNSYAALVFDCDSRASVEIAASACVGTGPVPPPNFAAERAASGHFHVGYFLRDPVHRGEGARAKPLAFLGRVSEYYRAALAADPGHVGVLSYNPVHGDYRTTYPRFEPYGLGELAAVMPKGWRVPKVPTTEVGRNWALFVAICKRSLRDTDAELEALAYTMAGEARAAYPGADHPFTDSEVRGLLRSVCRYRAVWRARGHAPWWIARQSRRGLAGGLNRRAAVRPRDLQIVLALDSGLSQREAAAVVGVSPMTVNTARARLARGGL